MRLEKFKDYCQFHQKFMTKLTHLIGVPLIVFSIMIILNWVEIVIHGVGYLPATWLLIAGLTLYYVSFDWKLAVITCIGLIILAVISLLLFSILPSAKGFLVFLACFFVGWLVQLIGHAFEGKLPAFTQNLSQIFTAPLFVTLEVAFWCGCRKDLQAKLNSP